MNKVLLSVLILLILNNCSASKKVVFWNKDDKHLQQIENNKTFKINDDTAAGAIAKEIKAIRLIIISDDQAVLENSRK